MLVAAIVVLAALSAQADKEYTAIKINVVDAQKGTPVARAAVTLKFIRGRKTLYLRKDRAEWDVKTDSNGTVQLPEIPSGRLRVLVTAKGYRTFGEDFDVSGDAQTISLKLSRPGAQFSSHETPEERRKKENEGAKKPQ